MVVGKEEETRKGPWTDEEDMQLVCFVGLFGERRWDFIAKVSGLRRTGKSCRLRWVNYLHPGLKRGRMSPQEERLVLELHSTWGNRWSRIARKLPGRTDNEIKNYWRTHMRKKAQEKKRNSDHDKVVATTISPSSSSSSSLYSNSVDARTTEEAQPTLMHNTIDNINDVVLGYPMEKIWDEIASSEMMINEEPNHNESWAHPNSSEPLPPPTPNIVTKYSSTMWGCGSSDGSLWEIDERTLKRS